VGEDNNNNGDGDGNYRRTKESSFLLSFFFINSVLYASLGSEIISSVPPLNVGI
jgi:hypothetical protein